MKTKFIIVLLSFVCSYSICAQKKVNIFPKSGKISYAASNSFSQYIADDKTFISDVNGLVSIEPSISKSGGKMIEGMDTKKVSKATLIVKIIDNIYKTDTIVKFSKEFASGLNQDADIEILNFAWNDVTFKSSLLGLINKFYSSASNCSGLSQKIKSLETENKLEDAIKIINLIEQNNVCNKEHALLKKDIIQKYSNAQCEKNLYDARVLIANGSSYNLQQATYLLMKIHPNSTCKNDALKVIEELSKKSDSNEANKNQLAKLLSIFSNNDQDAWYQLNNH
jgi:hypothetical protein